MARCVRCGKGGLFFKVNSSGLCAECELAQAKKDAEERQRKAQEEERIRREEAKPFVPPTSTNTGCQLVYRYDEVALYVPDECKVLAASTKFKTLLRLVHEPANTYDPKAVMVTIDQSGSKIGYINKGKLQDMSNDFLSRDDAVFASMNRPADGKYTIALYFYMAIDEFMERAKRKYTCKEFTLTGNTNEEMQDNIGLLSIGEKVDFTYDYDKNKHLASAGYGDIGYAPASATSIDLANNAHVFVSKLTERDSGKMAVSVFAVEGFTPGSFGQR